MLLPSYASNGALTNMWSISTSISGKSPNAINGISSYAPCNL